MQKPLRGRVVRVLWAGLVAGIVAGGGCATPKGDQPGMVVEKDVARVLKLPDGSSCTEPPGLSALLEAPGGQLASRLLATGGKVEEALAKEKDARFSNDELEAAWFNACRAYLNGEMKKDVFEPQRANYLALRQVRLAEGIRDWVNRKEGIREAGKLCMVVFGGEVESARNSTRWVPPETTVDDCALFATRAGGGDVLLGCTEGQWKNHWAKRTVAAGALGTRSRGQLVRDTPAAPEPNCGWL